MTACPCGAQIKGQPYHTSQGVYEGHRWRYECETCGRVAHAYTDEDAERELRHDDKGKLWQA